MVRCDEALKEWPEKERHKNYAVISLRCTGMSKLPDNLEFPKLHLLRLEHNYTSKLPDSFYGGMKEIKALSMLNVYIKGSQPTSLRWLTNLRSLSLYECGQINDVSVIGALENLEILGFEGTRIDELPKEIGQLSHLKLLDLLRSGVKRICPGVLLSLSKLEELYLGSSFNDEHRIEETKATLTELCGLSNFTTLVIHLQRFAYWPRDLVLTSLKAFAITISPMIFTRDSCDYQLQNQLSLGDLHESNLMESGFENLFKITKILEITQAVGVKKVGYDLDKDGFKKLTELFLKYCQDLEYVIDTTDGVLVPQIAFPVLQWLRLDHLDKLKEICHGQLSEEAFSALKRLELRDLPALTHLWKGPTQVVRLRNLTSLELKRCDKLESMFSLSIARYLMQLQKLDVSKCHTPNINTIAIPGLPLLYSDPDMCPWMLCCCPDFWTFARARSWSLERELSLCLVDRARVASLERAIASGSRPESCISWLERAFLGSSGLVCSSLEREVCRSSVLVADLRECKIGPRPVAARNPPAAHGWPGAGPEYKISPRPVAARNPSTARGRLGAGPARLVDNVNIHIDMLTFTLIRASVKLVHCPKLPRGPGPSRARPRPPTGCGLVSGSHGDLKYVIDTTDGVPVPQIAFPVLQWLCVGHLDLSWPTTRGGLRCVEKAGPMGLARIDTFVEGSYSTCAALQPHFSRTDEMS
ncbi:hypothetical protein HYC85_021880 [Camellia sinensis]|uniref:Disease resistance protein At4g27190-like leucine-rich repeats domain-containing protein n=1 Tax=Camellia sinensis TaxID=4442 RepID=A0A7J7GIT2_CAMSI|nr:hypothetical protein HYC85_021880 [Camellia sinensis]